MSKLLLSLHINRPDVNLESTTGFRVFDDKSLRLCDRAIREGCFGRHKKAAFVAYGPVYDYANPTRGPGYRYPDLASRLATEPNFTAYVRGLGTSTVEVGFGFDFENNEFHPWPKGRVDFADLVKFERFCDAVGRRDWSTDDLVLRTGSFLLPNGLRSKRAKARALRASV